MISFQNVDIAKDIDNNKLIYKVHLISDKQEEAYVIKDLINDNNILLGFDCKAIKLFHTMYNGEKYELKVHSELYIYINGNCEHNTFFMLYYIANQITKLIQ